MSFKCFDLLEAVELWAGYHNPYGVLITSERDLSNRFDEQIAPGVIALYRENDEPAMNEAFNNWSDMLCKEGEIHPEQYNEYCYVGEYSEM